MLLALYPQTLEACPKMSLSAGLSEVFMTGGIPPGIHISTAAEVAYNSLYRQVPEHLLWNIPALCYLIKIEALIRRPSMLHVSS